MSGALPEAEEKNFLVKVIKELLSLVDKKRGKVSITLAAFSVAVAVAMCRRYSLPQDHKAVIASNIMYVVGQYPRFLKQHWKFLRTVVNKLFEFMHESHPGVKDMVRRWLSRLRPSQSSFLRSRVTPSSKLPSAANGSSLSFNPKNPSMFMLYLAESSLFFLYVGLTSRRSWPDFKKPSRISKLARYIVERWSLRRDQLVP